MQVNTALAASPGPWFLPSPASADVAANGSPDEGFSLVDLTYVPHLERMAASTAYWKGLQLRGNERCLSLVRAGYEAMQRRVKNTRKQYSYSYSCRTMICSVFLTADAAKSSVGVV